MKKRKIKKSKKKNTSKKRANNSIKKIIKRDRKTENNFRTQY